MSVFPFDTQAHPDLRFRIDAFTVPAAAREAFEAAMRGNLDFLRGLPGFLGHTVCERTGGSTEFNLVTLAAWKNQAALEGAAAAMGARNRELGLDMKAKLAEWGVAAHIGEFHASPRLQ